MKTNLILVDLSWVMYRSAWVFTQDKFHSMRNGEDCPSGHFFGVLKSIDALCKMFGDDCDIVLCRDGVPKRRIELMGGTVTEDSDGKIHIKNGEYKAGRAKEGYSVHKDSSVICKVATFKSNVYYAYEKFLESDDLMYSLAKSERKYAMAWIYSGDNDLLQSIDDRIKVLRSLAKDAEVINEMTVKEKMDYGVFPSQLPMYRALRGDTSDNIPPIYPRLSKEFARFCASKFSSPEALAWVSYAERNGPWKNWFARILEPNRLLLLERNYKLMKLDVVPCEVKKSDLDADYVKSVLTYYGIPYAYKFIS